MPMLFLSLLISSFVWYQVKVEEARESENVVNEKNKEKKDFSR